MKLRTNIDTIFLSYIITPLLFVVILSGNSIIFSFVNNKFWGICAKPCSLIYITHPTLIVILINKKFLRGGKSSFQVYLIVFAGSIILGTVTYFVETFIEKRIKKFILADK